ncbi:MAG: HAD family phosphatase [Muribaculaceae bacterium]|nr:HAD family phosphatase [Muribaculaceae bacterium]
MKKPAAALFDLDGVLIDTEPAYTRIWSEIESHFPTGIENFAIKIKGSTLHGILSAYFPEKETQEKICNMLKESEKRMEYPLFDGVMDFLAELKKNNIPAAIVTSSNEAKMKQLFNARPEFAAMFKVVVTDADVTKSKPHPECYLKAAEKLGAAPEECIVFEDSFAGLSAGRDAGARVVALATTNPRHSLADKAHVVIDSFKKLSLDTLLANF